MCMKMTVQTLVWLGSFVQFSPSDYLSILFLMIVCNEVNKLCHAPGFFF